MLNDNLRDQKLIYDLDKIEEKENFIFELNWKKIDTPEGIVDITSPINVNFNIEKNSEGFLLKGSAMTKVKLQCSRCLKEFEQQIKGEIEAFYISKSMESLYIKSERLETLDNIIFFSEEKIDITDRIIESILMEIPEKPLCKVDCKGLCSVCGVDLNENPDHKHDEEYIDPRFEKLLDLFKEEK
ncbi:MULTISPECIES: YceD family protein [unclassified Marinitoga]|uniref:YceD family protein n=1 Tax=unclassified Marinitoga TaxID=2640159 RepID=UPI000640CA3F|nr:MULTISPECIES: DUF177 domain-containing protein [unclassified Marinitoga]KLO23904.1 DNA-binding protein [Marinitoga sp. 1155]NUU99125.1 hypothetical protein [Marinitoga sp. 1154]